MSKEVAVVTGANGRVGQETAQRLAAMGYLVVGLDLAPASNAGIAYQQCDVTDLGQIKAAADAIEAQHGIIRVLINNAGIWHGKSFFDITPADYDLNYGVNIRGAFFLTQDVSRRLIAAGVGGAIVSVASIVGQSGGGVTDYAGSKAAVINLTKSLSRVLGPHGIRVNAVSPAAINTAMGEKVPAEIRDRLIANCGLRRAAEPEEIADAITYLVGPQASYVNGAILDVNGGL